MTESRKKSRNGTNRERMTAVILAVIFMAAAPAMRICAADENAASGSAAAAQAQAATAAETATAAQTAAAAARSNADALNTAAVQAAQTAQAAAAASTGAAGTAVTMITPEVAEAAQSAATEAAAKAQEAEADANAKEQAAEQAKAAAEATRKAAEEQTAAQAAADRESGILNGISDYDRQLLGALIYYEAGGEPYQGKVAVGSVVINRMLSYRFPDDMSGVIYQSGQFVPARYCARLVQRGGVPAECQQAADEAIAGAKPVGDSVNFMRKEIHSGIVICCHAFFGHI